MTLGQVIAFLDRRLCGNDSGWHSCVLCGCPERGAHFMDCVVAELRVVMNNEEPAEKG
jgi:hypothetical protein